MWAEGSTEPVRVVYISGYGRSGTTVLDIVLGHHPSVFGSGELTNLTRHVWRENEYCACGNPARDCPFWKAVVARWRGCEDLRELDAYTRLQYRFEGIASWRRALNRLIMPRRFASYVRQTTRLFSAISSLSGKRTVVDSSKLPGRGFALALIPDIDLKVIHVVRDGRGVAWSLLQRYKRDVKAGLQKDLEPRPVARTAARWMLFNVATEALCRRLGPERCIRIRYEDFTADPEATLARIGSFLDLDLRETAAALKRGASIATGHQIAGSRARMTEAIRLMQDNSWTVDMPRRKQTTFNCLCGWMLRRYGYSLN
jgi:hypothetical protein